MHGIGFASNFTVKTMTHETVHKDHHRYNGNCSTCATSIYLQNAKRKRNKRMLHVVSNEGYETAGDILFPKREGPDKGLHYGPVLPN